MFKQDGEKNLKEVETIIGPSVKVKGNFNAQGNVVVEGQLEGNIKTSANIFIGDAANLSANIEAKEARIGGTIAGNIKVKGFLEISKSAKITGDIECGLLSIEKGAVLNGNLAMGKLEEKKEEKPVEKK